MPFQHIQDVTQTMQHLCFAAVFVVIIQLILLISLISNNAALKQERR